MTVKQISVLIENRAGSLVEVFQLLKTKGIQILVSTLPDTADSGVCRIICNNPRLAYDALREAGKSVSLTDVFAISLEDVPGCAADTISAFANEGVSLSYLYSFLFEGKGVLIFRTNDAEKAAEIIRAHKFSPVSL